ncbi:zinc ribbon domain-containing protein [bacterium]|nr:zinc ribbon domain-containing protein [candidate division CSSED10-310 bacterium]
MPMFDYRCARCRKLFTRIILKDPEKMTISCPECGSTDVERVISAFSTKSSQKIHASSCGQGGFT